MEILPATTQEREKDILWVFDLALWLKVVNGALEMLVAFLVLLIPPALVLKLVEFITGGELARDPDDPVMSALVNAAQSFTVHTHYLLAFYLVLHGGIKIILVTGIFMKKKIAYPFFMLALAIFGAYETYRGFVRHEILLQVLAILDFSILLLTSHEYRRRFPPAPAHSSSLGT